MAKGAVIFATRTNQTQKIAQLIGEGMCFEGLDVDLLNVNQVTGETSLNGYDAIVLGSATYHGEMLQAMKTFLFSAEKANLDGKQAERSGPSDGAGKRPDVFSIQ